jgi:flavin reductase (DIM6/NTAB) family NADH-FMN oxidoreductase RutF
MKIDPENLDHGGSHVLMSSVVVPRPIAFVSTIGRDGVFNVAPFSFFTGICVKPMLIGLSTAWKREGQKKDTLLNIEFARDFVVNIVDEALGEAMSQASAEYPAYVDEFGETGLTPVKADLIRSPLVAESPINMECRLFQIMEFGDARRASFVVGEVVRLHIKDELYVDNEIKTSELKVIARMGGVDLYCRTTDIFRINRPSAAA